MGEVCPSSIMWKTSQLLITEYKGSYKTYAVTNSSVTRISNTDLRSDRDRLAGYLNDNPVVIEIEDSLLLNVKVGEQTVLLEEGKCGYLISSKKHIACFFEFRDVWKTILLWEERGEITHKIIELPGRPYDVGINENVVWMTMKTDPDRIWFYDFCTQQNRWHQF